jgi:hypothetical protein
LKLFAFIAVDACSFSNNCRTHTHTHTCPPSKGQVFQERVWPRAVGAHGRATEADRGNGCEAAAGSANSAAAAAAARTTAGPQEENGAGEEKSDQGEQTFSSTSSDTSSDTSGTSSTAISVRRAVF